MKCWRFFGLRKPVAQDFSLIVLSKEMNENLSEFGVFNEFESSIFFARDRIADPSNRAHNAPLCRIRSSKRCIETHLIVFYIFEEI